MKKDKRQRSGLTMFSSKGKEGWYPTFKRQVNKYFKNIVHKFKYDYEQTYERPHRGSGAFVPGQFIKKGEKLKENKISLTMSIYVDTSGSMGSLSSKDSRVTHAWDCAFEIGEMIEKQYRTERVVDKTECDYYSISSHVKKIEGRKPWSEGMNTLDLEEYVRYIHEHSLADFLNVIITDGEFGTIGVNEIIKILDEANGLFILISNNGRDEHSYNEIEKRVKKKNFLFIKADPNFSLDE